MFESAEASPGPASDCRPGPPHAAAARRSEAKRIAPSLTPLLPPVGIVLLDLRHHPIELAGCDVRPTVLALTGHRDEEGRPTVAAGGVGLRRALACGAADQR